MLAPGAIALVEASDYQTGTISKCRQAAITILPFILLLNSVRDTQRLSLVETNPRKLAKRLRKRDLSLRSWEGSNESTGTELISKHSPAVGSGRGVERLHN